ncbi:MAG: hypothetical protein ACR9NN_01280 [Nostochopsis sp.]
MRSPTMGYTSALLQIKSDHTPQFPIKKAMSTTGYAYALPNLPSSKRSHYSMKVLYWQQKNRVDS